MSPRCAALLRLVTSQAMGLWPIVLLCTSIGAVSLAGGGVSRYLVAPVVGLLDDVPGDLSATYAERYRRRKCHSPQHNQKRVSCKLHRDPELRQRRKGRIHDDGVSSDARQHLAPGRASNDPGQEVSKQGRQDQDKDSHYNVRDVGYK